MEESYQKFAKDVLIIGVTNLLAGLSALVLLPLLTKTLGAHDYGIWSQINVTIVLISAVVGLGLPLAMTRFLAAQTNREEIQEEFYSVLSLVFLATLIGSSLLIIFAGLIADAFFEGATQIVRITGLVILVWSLDLVLLGLFRSFRQMKRYSIFAVADTSGQVGIIAYLVLSGHGILSVVLSVLAVRSALLFILLYLIKSQIGIGKPRFSRIKEYLSFGLPIVPGAIATWVVASSDRYVIGYFLGAESVGVYSAGYNLGNIPFTIAMVLAFVLPPTLSKLYDEGRMNEVKTHLSYSLKYFLVVAIPFVCGAALLGEQVLRMFSTPEIASQGYFIVSLVGLGTLFWGVYLVIYHIIVLVKKTKIIGAIWILAALLNLSLNIAIVPHIGIIGAAITTLIAYSLVLGVVTFYALKEFTFTIDWSFILKSIFASIIMSLVIWRIDLAGTTGTITIIVIGLIVYAVTLLLLQSFKKEEVAFFKELFGKE